MFLNKKEERKNLMKSKQKYNNRDAIVYALSCRRSGLPQILNLLAETIYRPEFHAEEVHNHL